MKIIMNFITDLLNLMLLSCSRHPVQLKLSLHLLPRTYLGYEDLFTTDRKQFLKDPKFKLCNSLYMHTIYIYKQQARQSTLLYEGEASRY